jgi:hypothetical protein
MTAPPHAGDPYPEPAEPPSPPGEEGPVQAPQEFPSPPPFDDTGRPTDSMLAQVILTGSGLLPFIGAPAVL